MTVRSPGLRERKKQATREALREAALRLAMEHGAESLRVGDIAEAAGVSPRTYNNYFSSREQAIVSAVTAEREAHVAAAVAARGDLRLSDAVLDAIVAQYTDPGESNRDSLLLVTTSPALREEFVDTVTTIERPLAEAITQRLGDADEHTARVLAGSVAAAVRIALEEWLQQANVSGAGGGLVVVSGSLPDLLRTALEPLTPALDAAERRGQR